VGAADVDHPVANALADGSSASSHTIADDPRGVRIVRAGR